MKLLNMIIMAAVAETPDVIFEPMNFVENLKYMGIGMLNIPFTIGIIAIVTYLLNKFVKTKK